MCVCVLLAQSIAGFFCGVGGRCFVEAVGWFVLGVTSFENREMNGNEP